MLKLIKEYLIKGVVLGIGFSTVVIMLDFVYFSDSNETEYFSRKHVDGFTITDTIQNKRGRYLTITGKIKGEDFTNVVYITINSLVFIDDQIVDRCFGGSYKSEESGKWYYKAECTDITSEHFGEDYRVESTIDTVRYKGT